MAGEEVISNLNARIVDSLSSISSKIPIIVGAIIFIIVLIGILLLGYILYNDKRKYNKIINVYGDVNGYWKRVYRDKAKTVKLGKGGFEILYLKKLKTWKIGYGGNFGDQKYDFYVMPDGYWYNGRQLANVNYIDDKKGLIPVVTTNPLMRNQYTALEKQIDTLHSKNEKWWDKYGSVVISIGFIVISGVFLWLMFREWRKGVGQLNGFYDQMKQLVNGVNNLVSNIESINKSTGGLIKVR